ncbi:hypothetical protein HUG17_0764 [Dermatophagoides farinae]|uniref:F-box domain-containing protein n=1 Tax=Dermatophagoides farinae TaxID=6954 RepID=A0A9D4P6Y4_DERFA|nr:hypothetical protein HUG17_0764 [Dermatophagoides farinae]
MPFIGQDWRSPGEVWIKTFEGWEPMKLLLIGHHQHHIKSSDPVPVPGKRRHESGDSLTTATTPSTGSSSCSSSSSSSSSLMNGSSTTPEPISTTTKQQHDLNGFSIADIIQRLQRSSSQPIPIDILKESSEQIEIYHTQPYYRITLNPTREVQGSNIISDAFYKLDFCNAIRDIRRFAYVSKLLHLLITQNLTSLSGNATKALFWMLEEIAKQVASNKQNIHIIRKLLIELREIVDKYLCWGRPLGSTSLWEQHLRTMERICEMTDAIEIIPPEPGDGKPSWSELPEELIREILLRLSDYKDLERSAQACQRMNSLLNEEQHIWKQLVKYHFTKDQLRWALRMTITSESINFNNNPPINTTTTATTKHKSTPTMMNIEIDQNADPIIEQNKSIIIDWERLFHLLRKKFGLKEEYADCLFLCRYCRCLFWKSKNHPCILENPDLTRQVLVTSPITGFKSTQHQYSTKYPSNSNNNENQQQQQQPLTAILRSRSLAFNHNNTNNNRRPPSGHRQQQQQQLPNGPVMVQNLPFFEHPLVIQRQRLNNHQQPDNNHDQNNEQNANAQQQQQQPSQTSFQKAPLHVPITPQAFLKFFSL